MNTMIAGTGFGAAVIRGGAAFSEVRTCSSRAGSIAVQRRRLKERSLWVRSEKDVSLEKWLLLLLAIAALAGIAYGFSCLVDLVQNWASMERGISSLI
jgi:hypothetical protein